MALAALLALLLQADDAVRAAAAKAVPLLEKSAAHYVEVKSCFSCHHQSIPLYGLLAAKAGGLTVDEKLLAAQAKFTWDAINGAKKSYQEGKGQGGAIATASYALWTLDLAGWKPDDTTAAVAKYVLDVQADQIFWKPPSNRPPQEFSPFTATALSIRSLRVYGAADRKPAADARIERVRDWLLKTKPKDTEDRVFRLRALGAAEAGDEAVHLAAKDLVLTQRPDGGWSQLDSMESDAYATGSALAALHDAGGMTAKNEVYRRGLKYLLGSQKEDGSWHVATRSKPVQKYFESDFPHAKDQFISISATAWSLAALSFALKE